MKGRRREKKKRQKKRRMEIDHKKLLFEAIKDGDHLQVRRLIESGKVGVEERSSESIGLSTPLHLATFIGQEKVVQILLECDADVNSRCDVNPL